MRLHAQCTLLGTGGTYVFLGASPAPTGQQGSPSVANQGFVANAAGTGPLMSDNATASRIAQGRLALGLNRAVNASKAHVIVSVSGVLANPPTKPARRNAATLATAKTGALIPIGMIAGANGVAVPAGTTAGRDVLVALWWQGNTTGAGREDDPVTTGGMLIHVQVFEDDANEPTT